MTLRKFSFGAAVALAMLGAGPVNAADLDPALEDPVQDISSLPVANVVFGSGWYVRGDFGGAQLYKAQPFYNGRLDTSSTAAILGSPSGVTLGQGHMLGFVGGVGGGYAFTSHLRADIDIDYHMRNNTSGFKGPVSCETSFTTGVAATTNYGACTGTYQANVQSYDAMVNAYYDLGTWYNVTPYIGAGIGLSFGHYQAVTSYANADGTSYNLVRDQTNGTPGTPVSVNYNQGATVTYYNFAYAAMAGFSFPIFDHTKVDIGYRYLALGNILGTNVHEHEVRAGLRYMIDN